VARVAASIVSRRLVMLSVEYTGNREPGTGENIVGRDGHVKLGIVYSLPGWAGPTGRSTRVPSIVTGPGFDLR
jgi:hypothetical protein